MGAWVDELARAMARGTSRKDVLKLVGALAGSLLAATASGVEAKNKNKKKGKKKRGVCSASAEPCTATIQCCGSLVCCPETNGICAPSCAGTCSAAGEACAASRPCCGGVTCCPNGRCPINGQCGQSTCSGPGQACANSNQCCGSLTCCPNGTCAPSGSCCGPICCAEGQACANSNQCCGGLQCCDDNTCAKTCGSGNGDGRPCATKADCADLAIQGLVFDCCGGFCRNLSQNKDHCGSCGAPACTNKCCGGICCKSSLHNCASPVGTPRCICPEVSQTLCENGTICCDSAMTTDAPFGMKCCSDKCVKLGTSDNCRDCGQKCPNGSPCCQPNDKNGNPLPGGPVCGSGRTSCGSFCGKLTDCIATQTILTGPLACCQRVNPNDTSQQIFTCLPADQCNCPPSTENAPARQDSFCCLFPKKPCGDKCQECCTKDDCPRDQICNSDGKCATCPAGQPLCGVGCCPAGFSVCCTGGQSCCSAAFPVCCPKVCCPTGSTCGPNDTCVPSTTCNPACASGLTCCGTACKNLQTDAANCGVCGKACPSGQTCSAGACVGGGTCSPACTGGTTCQNGVCRCPTGKLLCNGGCQDCCDDVDCKDPFNKLCRNGACTCLAKGQPCPESGDPLGRGCCAGLVCNPRGRDANGQRLAAFCDTCVGPDLSGNCRVDAPCCSPLRCENLDPKSGIGQCCRPSGTPCTNAGDSGCCGFKTCVKDASGKAVCP